VRRPCRCSALVCARMCSCSVGARIAGVVCACVCAGMQPEAARWAPTRPRAAEQATSRRYLMRVQMKNITFIFSSSQAHTAATVTEYSIETHDHPHITRRQKLKLHAANGVAITCYCLHEQHKHSAQADDAINRVSGSHCFLRTPTSAHLLIDDIVQAAR
jgi:hypothetical protein